MYARLSFAPAPIAIGVEQSLHLHIFMAAKDCNAQHYASLKPSAYLSIPIACNLWAITSAQQYLQPADILLQPVVGFHVISVHSIFEEAITTVPDKFIQFSKRLELTTDLLKQTPVNKVVHHHHIPKQIWISVGLCIALCLVCSGWWVTSTKLNGFISSDTKYRHLRLNTAHKSLQLYLDQLDSAYKTHSDFREKVLETEEEYRLNFERLRKAERLKTDAKKSGKSSWQEIRAGLGKNLSLTDFQINLSLRRSFQTTNPFCSLE